MRKPSGLRSWRFDSMERPTQPDESRALLSSCAGGCVKHPEPKSPERLLRTNAEWRRERALAHSDGKKQVAHCDRCRERVVCAPIFLFGWHGFERFHRPSTSEFGLHACCGVFYGCASGRRVRLL